MSTTFRLAQTPQLPRPLVRACPFREWQLVATRRSGTVGAAFVGWGLRSLSARRRWLKDSHFLSSFWRVASLADRLEPRRILFVTQGAALVFALLLSILTVSGLVQVWSVVLLAFLSSAVSSFDQPARAALLPRLVPPEDLANAVALQTLAFNTAATLGPTLAGVCIA